jgi:hypothetical protein
VLLNILSFIRSRLLRTTVSLVSRKLNRLANESSLWHHVHFHATDSSEYIAAVLARFRNTVRSVTVQCGEVDVATKLGVLVGSQISFEEIHVVKVGGSAAKLDFPLVLQLLGESTRTLSFREDGGSRVNLRPMDDVPPHVLVPPKAHLLSLDLSAVTGLDDGMIEVIVASCPQLELLHVGNFTSNYRSVGIRAIADGLPNLTSVFVFESAPNNQSSRYLLSKKPGLSALGLRLMHVCEQSTAVLISQMRNLQYLDICCSSQRRASDNLKAVFENANFGQLKSLLLRESSWIDPPVLKAIALACPKLEQVAFRWIGREGPPSGLDDAIKLLFHSCPELRVFWTLGVQAATGEGWLDNVGTLLPHIRCVVVTSLWRDEARDEMLERADTARSSNPKICVMIGRTPHQFNEDVVISCDDVSDVIDVPPRLCDLRAGRVRFPDVLQEAAHSQLAKRE